jgi:hypothetical protein
LKGKEMENEIIVSAEPENSVDLVAMAGERAKLFKMAISKLPECTSADNWTDQGGKPYLDDNGCERMARVVGMGISDPHVNAEMETDLKTGEKFYAVELTGFASIKFGDGVELKMPQTGGCTSRDKFFKSRDGITSLDIKKKAYANYRGRCIRSFLGIGGLSWEELEKAGIHRDGCKKVDFRQGKESGKSADGDDARTKLEKMILTDCCGEPVAAKDLLYRLTEWEKDGKKMAGKENVADLSDKQAAFGWGNYKPGGQKRDFYQGNLDEILKSHGLIGQGAK